MPISIDPFRIDQTRTIIPIDFAQISSGRDQSQMDSRSGFEEHFRCWLGCVGHVGHAGHAAF